MKLKTCPACGNKVSKKAKTCPQCGHPLDNFWTKKRSSLWLLLIFFVLIYLFAPSNSNKTTSKTNTSPTTHLTEKQKEKILKIVKSEPKVKDAIFPNGSDNLLYVGMYDNGSRRDGFAEYLCISINEKVKLPHQIFIKIVDYKDILQQKGFREIGRYFCNPMKTEKVKSIKDI